MIRGPVGCEHGGVRLLRVLSLVVVGALAPGCSSDSATTVEPAVVVTAAAPSTAPAAPSDPTDTATDPGSADSSDGAETSPPPPVPSLATVPCAEVVVGDTTCFELTVAADRDSGDDRTMTLPGLVLAANEQPARGALVIPGGGPGYTETGRVDRWAAHPFRSSYDIVLYDQRGTGNAVPNLECEEHDEELVAGYQSAEPYPTDRFALAEASLVCQARLAAGGIGFDDYDTAASAADLDELRAALGYEQWTIVGISYGSRLALESMRSHPAGLRSVILDSVYDVTAGGVAAALASGERAIAELVADHPGLDTRIEAARARYNATPWEGEVDLGDGTGPKRFVITGDDMIGSLFTALYDRDLIPFLPGLVAALEAGDTSAVPAFLADGLANATAAADAMRFSVDCADNAGLDRVAVDDATADDAGRLTAVASYAGPSCLDWDVEPTRRGFNEPVVSDIPALVLAGRFDPITPPDGSRAVADRLPNGQFVLFPTFGHGATGDDPCATAIELQFLADPTAPVDTSCITS